MPMLRFGKVWQVIRHFEVLFFAIYLGTSKTIISKFVTTANIVTPYLSQYGYPNNVPVSRGTEKLEHEKKSSSTMY